MKPWKIVLIILVAGGLIAAAVLLDLPSLIGQVLEYIRTLGIWGPVLYIALYVLATVAFIPGSIITLASGLLFGVVYGSIYVSIGSTIGAGLAFLVGRFFLRGWVQTMVDKQPKFAAIDRAVEREGWKIVLLTRLSPIFPYNVLNYAYGLTRVRFWSYLAASWAGMIPGTVMYVYFGSLAGDLGQLAAGAPADESGTTLRWVLNGIGLAATVLVTLVVTRMARKALSKHVEDQ